MRAASLEENNTSAYWKYAIGEVVFVVVGILLAFQIDTWSENRSAKEHTHYLFAQVQDELALNIKSCNLVLDEYRGKDTLVYDILKRRVTKQDYRENWEYGLVLLTQQEAEVSVCPSGVCHKVCQWRLILWVLGVNWLLIHSISNQSH